MFIFIDGVMGGGKSYYAVDYIVKNYAKYQTIYTNINGFKFNRILQKARVLTWSTSISSMDLQEYNSNLSFVSSVGWSTPKNAKPLNWDKILDVVQECKDIYDKALFDIGDDDDSIELDDLFVDYLLSIDFIHHNPAYIDYRRELSNRNSKPYLERLFLDISKPLSEPPRYRTVLLVLDEAYNFFDKSRTNDLLLWFISYSRHMFIDAILLSQANSDIHQNYLKRIEYFLFALPSSRQTKPGYFTYRKHVKAPYYDGKGGTYAGDVSIKKIQRVFSIYKSGNKVKITSVYFRYFIFLLIFIFAFMVAGFLLYDYIFTNIGEEKITPDSVVSSSKSVQVKGENIKVKSNLPTYSKDSKYLKLSCINKTCTNPKAQISINLQDLKEVIKATNSKHLRTQHINKDFANIYMIATPSFLQLFLGAKNEKKDINIIGGFGNS